VNGTTRKAAAEEAPRGPSTARNATEHLLTSEPPMAKEPETEGSALPLVSNRALPYASSRLAARIDLVDMAQEIEKADQAIGMVVGGKLEVIRDQMRALQEEARRLLEEARVAARLHRARCNFRKIPGKTYHLYKRSEDELYFSMLSPADWGGSPPHAFEGSYRLEVDMSWTPLGEIRERADGRAIVAELLQGGEPTGFEPK